jgi:hypothetical protein
MLLVGTEPASASTPEVAGEVSGVELCPQVACGAAIFTGTFHGEVGNDSTPGFFWAKVQHDSLPTDPNEAVVVFGGKWSLSTFRGRFRGRVIDGMVSNNGDNTFTVRLTLQLRRGGKGEIFAEVVLDHNDFPPDVEGELFQPE